MIYDYNEQTGELKLDSEMIYLTPKENCIFRELYRHKNEIVSKKTLIEALTKDGYQWFDNKYISVIICRINNKIKNEDEDIKIVKGYGFGYRLKIRSELV